MSEAIFHEGIDCSPENVRQWIAEAGRQKARAEAAERNVARVEAAIYAAWDDGNAMGLDGYIGPERGDEPDPEAIYGRKRYVEKALAALADEETT